MSELLNKQKTKELIRTLRQLMPELQRQYHELEEKLAALLNIKVDLVMKEALKSKIGGHIIAEVILI